MKTNIEIAAGARQQGINVWRGCVARVDSAALTVGDVKSFCGSMQGAWEHPDTVAFQAWIAAEIANAGGDVAAGMGAVQSYIDANAQGGAGMVAILGAAQAAGDAIDTWARTHANGLVDTIVAPPEHAKKGHQVTVMLSSALSDAGSAQTEADFRALLSTLRDILAPLNT